MLDLSKSHLPLVLALALGSALALSGFSIGASWNSSAKDIQQLQLDVKSLSEQVRDLDTSLRNRREEQLTNKDLLLFCYRLTGVNKDFKCPSSP